MHENNGNATRFHSQAIKQHTQTSAKAELPRTKTALRAMTREALDEPSNEGGLERHSTALSLFGGASRHHSSTEGAEKAARTVKENSLYNAGSLSAHRSPRQAAALSEEKRQDTDGGWYTRAVFQWQYGRDDEWQARSAGENPRESTSHFL